MVRCKCGKEFLTGYAFSSHRCEYKKNAGAYIGKTCYRCRKKKAATIRSTFDVCEKCAITIDKNLAEARRLQEGSQ